MMNNENALWSDTGFPELSKLAKAQKDFHLSQAKFAKLLGVALSTYTGWFQRKKVPSYIQAHIEALYALNKKRDAHVRLRLLEEK